VATGQLGATIDRDDGSMVEELATRLTLLDALAGLAQVTARSLDSATALDGFSAAVRPLIPHDWVNVAWLEEDQRRFHMIGAMASKGEEACAECQEGDLATAGCPFLAHTLRTGQPQLVDDYPADPRWAVSSPEVRALVTRAELRAGMSVALRVGGRVTGALVLASREPGEYAASHLAIAQQIADQLAPFVENLRLYTTERRQREHIEALNEIGQTIAASLEVEDVFSGFATAARRLVAHDRVGVDLVSDDGAAFEPLAWAAHDTGTFSWGQRVPLDETDLTLVLTNDAPLWSNDLREDPRVVKERDREAVQKEGIAGMICAPLRANGRPFGILTFTTVAPAHYGETEVGVVQQIADQIAPFLANVRLYRQVRALAAAEERNRLAREVHDTLAQGLTAIALQLDAASLLLPAGASAAPLVTEARELTRRSLEEARRAVWGLHPSPLENRPLAEALEAEAAEFSRRSGVAVSFDLRGEPVALDVERATALFRIAQESLHNVEKHAEASRVRVELQFRAADPPEPGAERAAAVVLRVADDGRGFAPETVQPTPEGGFGLCGMHERARLAGGTLEIESAPGWGTRLVVQLPLGRVAAPADATAPAAEAPATETAPIRVLIVDDHALARAGIRRLLDDTAAVVVVGEAVDGYDGVAQALALRPDVVLMDLQLPRLSGVQAVRELRGHWPDVRVLIVTTFAQDEHLFEALKAGARGYLLKDASRAELLQGIQTVHQGGSLVQPVVASRLLDRFGALEREREHYEPLTEREREVLVLVASGARTRAIAEQLVVSEKTVKYHLTQIYQKLSVSGRTGAIARARALDLLPHDDLLLA
jgi:signal transduction histidine kinase/DNA-binding NarL/FixJ family response regulator